MFKLPHMRTNASLFENIFCQGRHQNRLLCMALTFLSNFGYLLLFIGKPAGILHSHLIFLFYTLLLFKPMQVKCNDYIFKTQVSKSLDQLFANVCAFFITVYNLRNENLPEICYARLYIHASCWKLLLLYSQYSKSNFQGPA